MSELPFSNYFIPGPARPPLLGNQSCFSFGNKVEAPISTSSTFKRNAVRKMSILRSWYRNSIRARMLYVSAVSAILRGSSGHGPNIHVEHNYFTMADIIAPNCAKVLVYPMDSAVLSFGH